MNIARTIALLSLCASGCLLSPDDLGCASAASCEECTQLAGCGWCPSLGCVSGTPAGPAGQGLFCENDYRWDECSPRVDPCAVHTSRDRCSIATSCQWCESAGVCILDGARCGPSPPSWTRTGAAPSSPHPYDNSTSRSWSLGVPARATAVRVYFSRVELESGYDFVELLDGGTVVHTLTGSDDGEMVSIGRATEVRLRTDGSVTRWGFEIAWVEYR